MRERTWGAGFIGVYLTALMGMAAGCGPVGPADVGGMTRQSHEAFFPITQGPHAGADCRSCHGAADSFTQFNCTSCHEHDRQFSDAAHHALIPGYAFAPTSCVTC